MIPDLRSCVRIARVEDSHVDRPRCLVERERNRAQTMAQSRREAIHELGCRDDLLEGLGRSFFELGLETRLVDHAQTDECTRKRNALSHDRIEPLG
jgi:hypothetical protein